MKAKVIVAILGGCLFCLYGNFRLFRTVSQYSGSSLIRGYDGNRYAKLKAALPPHSVVGYVDDEPDKTARDAKYAITRYVLVPAVVAQGPDYPLVVGNFRDAHKNPEEVAAGTWTLVQDFGNGVKLFRTQGPR